MLPARAIERPALNYSCRDTLYINSFRVWTLLTCNWCIKLHLAYNCVTGYPFIKWSFITVQYKCMFGGRRHSPIPHSMLVSVSHMIVRISSTHPQNLLPTISYSLSRNLKSVCFWCKCTDININIISWQRSSRPIICSAEELQYYAQKHAFIKQFLPLHLI